jgi:hypothetical protein
MGQAMKADLRSPIAKSRDAYFETFKGKKACEGSAEGQYLRNRLEAAYLAGYRDGAQRGIDDMFKTMKNLVNRR